MPKCDFSIKLVNLLHIFRIPFPKITSGRLLLNIKFFYFKPEILMCPLFFINFLFFSPNDSPSKIIKNVFHFI